MSRKKGSGIDPGLKKQIQKVGYSLSSIRKKYGKEVSDFFSKLLSIPSSGFFTKSGGLTTSKKLWDTASDAQIKALYNVDIPSAKDLRNEALQSLEESGVLESLNDKYAALGTKKGFIKERNELIQQEVQSMVAVEGDFEAVRDEWYMFRDAFALSYPAELSKIDRELYQKGKKSYTELHGWMQEAQEIMMKISMGEI